MVRLEKKEEQEEEEQWPLFENEEYGAADAESVKVDNAYLDWPMFEEEDEDAAAEGIHLPVRDEKSPADDIKLEGEHRETLPKDDTKKLEPEDNALGYEPTSPAFAEDEERKIDLPKAANADPTELATELEPPVLRSRHLQPVHQDSTDLHLTDVAWETTVAPMRRPTSRAPIPPVPLRVPRAPVVEEKVVPCPNLLVGSKLDKACPLRPGRWVEVGRNSKAHVLVQNPAVSKHHCKLQWKRGSSTVELRVLDGITHLNDRRLQLGSAMSLKHGDLLKIYGKGTCFRLLLDMQQVDAKLPSVRTLPGFTQKEVAQAQPRSQEDELRRKIKKLKALADAAREKAMLSEQRLAEVQTRRKLRAKEIEESLEKSKHYEKDGLRLEELLVKSRDGWLERLQKQSTQHHKDALPLTQETSDTQDKLSRLQHLKEGVEMQLHPERHQRLSEEPADDVGSNVNAKVDEADGEEEAFPDSPAEGVKEDKLKDEKGDKPSIEVLPTAPTGTDEDVADLFGEFNSDDDDEAPLVTTLASKMKRPAPDVEVEQSLKKTREDSV